MLAPKCCNVLFYYPDFFCQESSFTLLVIVFKLADLRSIENLCSYVLVALLLMSIDNWLPELVKIDIFLTCLEQIIITNDGE